MSNLRFSVYEHKLVYDGDHLLKRQLIVLKDGCGNIVGWTNFHRYAKSGKNLWLEICIQDQINDVRWHVYFLIMFSLTSIT